MRLPQTPSQTVGPFFKPALIRSGQESLVTASTRGERVAIEGCVLDGDAAAVSDAMVELWQANADGCYDHPEDLQERAHHPDFHGFGRAATDERGRFRFHTIKPGPVAGPGGSLFKRRTSTYRFSRAAC